ncbi:hypothetical protein [Polymorphospora sp. NPDC050346]|uniref:hypothetical protein n=1 Tax=Polymorphospora sp. NPDC050346 TaxID=3155780 RepID=UPI0033EB42F0
MFAEDEDKAILIAPCIRCGITFASNPHTVPSFWVNQSTRCPLRPDWTPIEPGEPGTDREPLCKTCTPIIRAATDKSVPLTDLFPRARLDRFDPTGT